MFSFFKLPDADEQFMRFFDRWYTLEDRQAKGIPATRPDMTAAPEFVGCEPMAVSRLQPEAASDALARVSAMLAAAEEDWPTYLSVAGTVDLSWVREFDEYYNKKQVRQLVARSKPDNFGNDYVVVACEFGAVLGQVLQDQCDRLQWVAGHPYWESSLFDSKTGFVIPVFHWAIKKLSGYGLNDGFAAKIQACVRVLGE